MDVRLEFETQDNFAIGSSSAYASIINGRIIENNPMSGDLKKINRNISNTFQYSARLHTLWIWFISSR